MHWLIDFGFDSQSTHNPMRLQDIAIVTNTPLETDMVLLEKFKSHDRIVWDPKTDLYSYRVCLSYQLFLFSATDVPQARI
jgi:hypothetical protein